MKINILTIFPEMFAPLKMSMLGRAAENGILEFDITDIRDYTTDKHNRVDDTPYGGGAGMVMQVQPILDAFNGSGCGGEVIYMSPRGEMLSGDIHDPASDEVSHVVLALRQRLQVGRLDTDLHVAERFDGRAVVKALELYDRPILLISDVFYPCADLFFRMLKKEDFALLQIV